MSADTPQSLINLVQSLSHVITYADSSNVDTNRKLWDNYARDWVRAFLLLFASPLAKDADYVVKMVKNLEDSKDVAPEEYLSLIGEEWSDKSSFQQVMEDFFWPNISETSLVAELGSGGGRVATRVVTRVGELHCYDISKEMLKKAEVAVHASLKLSGQDKPTKFVFLQEPAFPTDLANTFDFVYAFDVFPHVDLHTQWKYYQEFLRVLKPGCKAIIHTANLEAPEGWQRFSQQDKYSVGGFYFMVPSMVLTLVSKAGLTVLKTSDQVKAEKGADRASNTYYNRDFMVLVQKPL